MRKVTPGQAPSTENHHIVRRVICEELCVGAINENTKAQLVIITDKLTAQHGTDGYDTAALQASAAAKFACS